jgi:hypothetical protein
MGKGIEGEAINSQVHRSRENQLLVKGDPVGIVVIRHGD